MYSNFKNITNQMTSRIIPFFAALLLFCGCNKVSQLNDIEVVETNPEFALPLLNANFTFQSMVESLGDLATVTIEPDGCIRLTYEGEVLREGADVITNAINESLPLGIPVIVASDTMTLPFNVPGEYEFDIIRLKQGTLLSALNNVSSYGNLTVQVIYPNFSKDGAPIIHTFQTDGGNTYGESTDLADATINPEEDGTLKVIYTAVDSDGNNVTLPSNVFFNILDDLQFAYLEGYLGEEVFDSTPGDITIDFFDDIVGGNVYFADPTITMTVTSSFGIPVSSKAEYFDVININGDTLALQSDELGEDLSVNFNYPALDEVGETKETVYIFNKDNSNIAEIIGSGPRLIRYDIDALPNPDQNTALRGFISCESEYFVHMKADLPIYGYASDFNANQKFDLNFGGYENVKSAEFKIITENELPIDIDMQLYFLNVDGAIVDSLFNEATKVFASPNIDETGVTTGSAEQTLIVPIEANRFRTIADNAKQAEVKSSFSTNDYENETAVKVKADQKMGVRIGLKIVTQ